ncbi:MAG: dTMP kinase [Desulfobulbaceae bacterium]|nr:dTMP kinase [Desulfobulbaceae bacterium]
MIHPTNKDEKKGVLIVFEGTDGTGKSTQQKLLADYLNSLGHQVVTTREPTDGPFGQKIRNLYVNRGNYTAEDELSLFLNDRREHVETLLTPALNEGKIILCDRYFLSTVAYQGAIGFDIEDLLQRNSFAPDPDIALLFQAPLETGRHRITSGRGDTLNDFEKSESLVRVAEIFRSINRSYIQPVDATGSIEEVHQRVVSLVLPLLSGLPGPSLAQE